MNTQAQLAERNTSTVARQDDAKARKGPTIVPAVDINEDAHGITLWADAPGVWRDRLNGQGQDGPLFIEGEALVESPAGLRLHYAEIREPRFARAFSLS